MQGTENSRHSAGRRPDDEIDIADLLLVLWGRRYWILAGSGIATVLGLVYALLAAPVYVSSATIAPKEAGKGGDATRLLSQLGGMGGMMATQLGIGNAGLNKMEILLKGYELAEGVIVKNELLPALFPAEWDSRDSAWISKDTAMVPKLTDGIKLLRERSLKVTADAAKSILKASVSARDPALAQRLLDLYLAELNDKIRNDVIREAEENRNYLEKQLSYTVDPILGEKIRAMIGSEVEKSMLISSQAFEVLERPVEPVERSRPNRKLIVIMSFLLGAFLSVAAVFAWRGAARLIQAAGRPVRSARPGVGRTSTPENAPLREPAA